MTLVLGFEGLGGYFDGVSCVKLDLVVYFTLGFVAYFSLTSLLLHYVVYFSLTSLLLHYVVYFSLTSLSTSLRRLLLADLVVYFTLGPLPHFEENQVSEI